MTDEQTTIVLLAVAKVIGNSKKLMIEAIEGRVNEKEAFNELLVSSTVDISIAFQEAFDLVEHRKAS